MSERMTDERLAEIENAAIVITLKTKGSNKVLDSIIELLQALKAERAQLAEIETLPDKWEQEDTGYYAEMRQCADQLTAILAKSNK